MPFKSKAQRGFMYSEHPKLAKEFEEATPTNAKLPEHVQKMAYGGETNPKHETLAGMENNPTAGFADGGEVHANILQKLVEAIRNSDMGNLGTATTGLQGLANRRMGRAPDAQGLPGVPMLPGVPPRPGQIPPPPNGQTIQNFSDGGEVQESPFMKAIHALVNHRADTSKADDIDPVVSTSSDTAKGYADGGQIPSLSDTTAALNSTPDTNYDFYGQLGPDQRQALFRQLQDQKKSAPSLIASGLGGLGDAIANSFGNQHAHAQDDVIANQNQRQNAELGAFDTQREQKLQGMQASQDQMMNDPNHPIAKAMQQTLRSAGLNVPSGMPAGVMLKVAGPLGELAMKQATQTIQQGQANEAARHNKVEEANMATGIANTGAKQQADIVNAQTARKETAAKGLQERPWYQKGFEAVTPKFMNSDATNEMRSELKQPEAAPMPGGVPPMTATNSMGHKITSKDGGQTWQ